MSAVTIANLAVLVAAIYLAWSFSKGSTGRVPLYAVPCTVFIALIVGAAAQLVGAAGLAEVSNTMAIAFSVAALAVSPGLWREQVREDLKGVRLTRDFRLADLYSWRAWLKLVDRVGASGAALGYLGTLLLAIIVAILTSLAIPQPDQVFVVATLLIPLPFALLSALWLYRAAKRLVPAA